MKINLNLKYDFISGNPHLTSQQGELQLASEVSRHTGAIQIVNFTDFCFKNKQKYKKNTFLTHSCQQRWEDLLLS